MQKALDMKERRNVDEKMLTFFLRNKARASL